MIILKPFKFKLDQVSQTATFFAGLGSGVTEAILVVTPAEVCKIRLQAQFHSMMDPAQLAHRKYKVRKLA